MFLNITLGESSMVFGFIAAAALFVLLLHAFSFVCEQIRDQKNYKLISITCVVACIFGSVLISCGKSARSQTVEKYPCFYQWQNLKVTKDFKNSVWVSNLGKEQIENIIIKTVDYTVKLNHLAAEKSVHLNIPYSKGGLAPIEIEYGGRKIIKDFTSCPVR